MNLKECVGVIEKYLSEFTYIPPTELLHFVSLLSYRKVSKGDFFLSRAGLHQILALSLKVCFIISIRSEMAN